MSSFVVYGTADVTWIGERTTDFYVFKSVII